MQYSRASRLLLEEAIEELQSSLAHLNYSFQSMNEIEVSVTEMSEEQLQVQEAFTSRFSRVVDLFVNKTLRALDRYELVDSLTLLDVANRAEKRGLIPSTDWLREMKDVRNQIAHDYSGAKLASIIEFCMEKVPELVEACQATILYAKDRL